MPIQYRPVVKDQTPRRRLVTAEQIPTDRAPRDVRSSLTVQLFD